MPERKKREKSQKSEDSTVDLRAKEGERREYYKTIQKPVDP